MTEHTYSRARPTDSELDKLRSRLGGKVEPNASGVMGDILPGSTASLAARLKQPDLSDEQKAAAEYNRRNREHMRLQKLALQRRMSELGKTQDVKEARVPPPPTDPVNGEVDPLDAPSDFDAFTAGMTDEEKAEFKKYWAAGGEPKAEVATQNEELKGAFDQPGDPPPNASTDPLMV